MIALRLTAFFAALFLAACTEQKPLSKHFELPKFTLTERSGQPFDSTSLRGKVWVADFFFTSCPGTCLMLSKRMREIHGSLAKDENVRFVSISTDPANDTPEVMTKYAEGLGADSRWAFVTGPHDAVFDLSIKGFNSRSSRRTTCMRRKNSSTARSSFSWIARAGSAATTTA